MIFKKAFLIRLLGLVLLVLAAYTSQAQEVTIELGQNRLPITEYYTISIKLRAVPLKSLGEFPEIAGFQKSNRSRTKSRINAGNKSYTEETITQNYAALKEGDIVLKPFSIQVNGKSVTSPGATIRIEPEPKVAVITPIKPKPIELLPNPLPRPIPKQKTLSFLSLETNKSQVYVGEGVRLQLYFYVAESELGLLDFYNFGNQLPEIIKKLKQQQVWEDIIDLKEVKPDTITIKDQDFIRFKLYESILFPLNAEALKFPSVSLIMAQRPKEHGYAAGYSAQELVPFISKTINVAVKLLPPHPLRETIPVGQFQLRESINKTVYQTDRSFVYTFEVAGIGNFSALTMPAFRNESGLDIYPPAMQQYRNRSEPGTGTKIFKYTILGKTPGHYNLGKIFKLPYFNPSTGRYDTLRSDLQVRIVGAADRVSTLSPEETDPFYKLIKSESNELTDLNKYKDVKLYANVIILLLICASLYAFFKK